MRLEDGLIRVDEPLPVVVGLEDRPQGLMPPARLLDRTFQRVGPEPAVKLPDHAVSVREHCALGVAREEPEVVLEGEERHGGPRPASSCVTGQPGAGERRRLGHELEEMVGEPVHRVELLEDAADGGADAEALLDGAECIDQRQRCRTVLHERDRSVKLGGLDAERPAQDFAQASARGLPVSLCPAAGGRAGLVPVRGR